MAFKMRSNPIKRNFKQAPLKKMSFQDFKDIGKLQADSKKAAEKKDPTMKDTILGK